MALLLTFTIQIRATLDINGKNRGLEFAPEMMQFCGRRFYVMSRVGRIIMETTAKMLTISDTVILEAATCDGCFHRGCARNHLFHWREIWLKRVPQAAMITPVDPFADPFLLGAEPIESLGKAENCALDGVEVPNIPDPYIKRLEALLDPGSRKGKHREPSAN